MKKYEIRNCEKGEVNKVTKDYWCNAYQEFCSEIDYCAIKTIYKKVYNEQRIYAKNN